MIRLIKPFAQALGEVVLVITLISLLLLAFGGFLGYQGGDEDYMLAAMLVTFYAPIRGFFLWRKDS